jgi:hypothetical protein
VTLRQSYTGRSPYQPDSEAGIHSLLVAVECRIGDFPNAVLALLDTASHWCVLPPEIAEALGYSAEPTDLAYLTRFGRLEGRLHLIPVFFVAYDGDTLQVDATWFVAGDWTGPAVIGWKGCLERMRFALDPAKDHIYFSDLSEPAELL